MIDLIDSLIGYVNDIKPYHTKIFGVEVEYVVKDEISVTVTEDLRLSAYLGLPICSIIDDQLSMVGSPTVGWGTFDYDNLVWDKLRDDTTGSMFCIDENRYPTITRGHDGYPHDSTPYDILTTSYLRNYPEPGQQIPKPTGFLDYVLTTISERITFDTTIVGNDVPDVHTIIHRMWDNPLDGIRVYSYGNDSFYLRGDYTYLFNGYGSEPFPIINSSYNNGIYSADSVEYDPITNLTTVYVLGSNFNPSVSDGLVYIGLFDSKEWDGNPSTFVSQPDANVNAASTITECFKIQDGYGFDDPNIGFDATVDDDYDVPAGEYHNPIFFDAPVKWDDGYYIINAYSNSRCDPCLYETGFSGKSLDSAPWDSDKLLPGDVWDDGGYELTPWDSGVIGHVTCDSTNSGIVVFSPYRLPTPNPIPSFDGTFTQDAPSTTWIVDHNLGYYPMVRAYSGGIEIQPSNVAYVSLNRVILTFSSPIQGIIRVV